VELLLYLAEFKDASGQSIDPVQLPRQPARSESGPTPAAPEPKPSPQLKPTASPAARSQPPHV
jgi:hypothetical protein